MAAPPWGPTLRRLVADGHLDGPAALAGRVHVEPASRSNAVGIVTLDDGAVVVLKRPQVAGDDIDPLTAEIAAYRFLADDTGTTASAPRLIAVVDCVLVLSAVAEAEPLHLALGGSRGDAWLRALGTVLGRLHTSRAAMVGLPERRPWILELLEGRLPEIFAQDPAISRQAGVIVEEPGLAQSLRVFTAAWGPLTPIHGDVKFDNVLVARDPCDGGALVLIDWELAGRGLPEWDLAGVADGLVVPGLQEPDGPAVLDSPPLADAMAGALAAYRVAAPARNPDPAVLHAAFVARLIQSSLQLQAMRHEQPECAEASARVLEGARAAAGRGVPTWLQ